ncbi:HTH domain-containing protein [Marispirochaeta sp.]|uniref:HTH domain-containing protein n=1 Tax=Marispirochaeta sp. TaxID=2038653 RepID=UPI0029C7D19B|nr:HTH domain-containing protein [Marispirochaeta sp.]
MSINPLARILLLTADPRIFTIHEIAERVEVSVETAEQMIAGLQRMGYLENPAAPCTHCRKCSKRPSSIPGTQRIWELSGKGKTCIKNIIGTAIFFDHKYRDG